MAEAGSGRLSGLPTVITNRTWLSEQAFELRISRPNGFDYRAGQKILCRIDSVEREYTIAFATADEIALCVRYVAEGFFSAKLANMAIGENFFISDPYGFFVLRSGRSVFVATGTGMAPFRAFIDNGATGFTMLHGVNSEKELYYRKEFEKAASLYVPCISGKKENESDDTSIFRGRVTHYLESELVEEGYDFYLCGNGMMVHDATLIIDRKWQNSRIFTEKFF